MNYLLITLITTFLPGVLKAQDISNVPTFSPTYITNSFYNGTDLTDCGNGKCDEGENCLSCAVDCISGTSGGFECGNGVCEDGETCYTCPEDCMSSGQMTNDEEGSFCCYGGKNHPKIDNAVSCNDFRCSSSEITCDSKESPLVTYCCGDGTCSGEESSLSCEIDNCVELCGNGVCDEAEGENAETCSSDCTCNLDGICESWETIHSCPLDCTCGNRQCEYDLGETVANCMSDCACNANYKCEAWEDEKNCPRDCGMTAMYGNGDGHDGNDGYDGMDQQFDGSNGYDEINGNAYDYMNGGGDGSMNGDENDGNCLGNGEACTNNLDCCSSACDSDTYKCVG